MMIRARRQQLNEALGTELQRRYILSALFPQGKISPQAHHNLMNKLKNMGF